MGDALYIGIDYHQYSLQVCGLDAKGGVAFNRRCDNNIADILATVGPRVAEAAIEASCGASDLAEQLAQAGWSISLAHPGYVARIRQSPDKTDFSDARLLADLTRVGYLPRVWLAPTAVRELRLLIRERQSLAEERRRIKQRIRATLREQRQRVQLRAWTRAWLAWLREHAELSTEARWVIERRLMHLERIATEIAVVEARLRERTADDRIVAALLAQPGIGEVTAWTLRAEIGRFDRFRTGKQLARFCGLSPRNASSGERTADAGMIKAGRPELRAIIVEAAHRLSIHHPRWRAFRARLAARGKPGAVIAAAIANRWVRGLVHLMREEIKPMAA